MREVGIGAITSIICFEIGIIGSKLKSKNSEIDISSVERKVYEIGYHKGYHLGNHDTEFVTMSYIYELMHNNNTIADGLPLSDELKSALNELANFGKDE